MRCPRHLLGNVCRGSTDEKLAPKLVAPQTLAFDGVKFVVWNWVYIYMYIYIYTSIYIYMNNICIILYFISFQIFFWGRLEILNPEWPKDGNQTQIVIDLSKSLYIRRRKHSSTCSWRIEGWVLYGNPPVFL